MCRGIEAQHDALASPALRDLDCALIPDVTDVVLDGGIGVKIVIAGRHRDFTCAVQRTAPDTVFVPRSICIDGKKPKAAEALQLAYVIFDWSKHVPTVPIVAPTCDGRDMPSNTM